MSNNVIHDLEDIAKIRSVLTESLDDRFCIRTHLPLDLVDTLINEVGGYRHAVVCNDKSGPNDVKAFVLVRERVCAQ